MLKDKSQNIVAESLGGHETNSKVWYPKPGCTECQALGANIMCG
jgi:hypothetical protein